MQKAVRKIKLDMLLLSSDVSVERVMELMVDNNKVQLWLQNDTVLSEKVELKLSELWVYVKEVTASEWNIKSRFTSEGENIPLQKTI